jgi:DNA-binding response OmpR family regulator
LIEALWRSDADIGSNVVEVYVRSLRRKLDDGRRDGLIETVRGAGYRLRMPEPHGGPGSDGSLASRTGSP